MHCSQYRWWKWIQTSNSEYWTITSQISINNVFLNNLMSTKTTRLSSNCFFIKKKRFHFSFWWFYYRWLCLRISSTLYFTFDNKKHFVISAWRKKTFRLCQMFRAIDFFVIYSRFVALFTKLFETLQQMSNVLN